MEKNILIYGGPGTDYHCKNESLKLMHSFLGTRYSVQLVDENYLRKESWEETTTLIVLPGGADRQYMDAFEQHHINQRLRNFVFSGRRYLGICAGAYFAGKSIIYAPNTPGEIIADRALHFFPGTITGPHLAPYDNETKSGARCARITTEEQTKLSLYYHGGCSFPKNTPSDILASYDETGEPAIVRCSYGKGRAYLSGVHFEINPHKLDKKNPYLRSILPNLLAGNIARINFLRTFLPKILL